MPLIDVQSYESTSSEETESSEYNTPFIKSEEKKEGEEEERGVDYDVQNITPER